MYIEHAQQLEQKDEEHIHQAEEVEALKTKLEVLVKQESKCPYMLTYLSLSVDCHSQTSLYAENITRGNRSQKALYANICMYNIIYACHNASYAVFSMR
jgi:hypothetical protein